MYKVTRGQLIWVQDGSLFGLPDLKQEFERQYCILKIGNEKEGTELKCQFFALGLVTFLALTCGAGLLISQVEGGFYPAMCLVGISVGFAVGMVIAWQMARNKQKTLEQTFDNYQKEEIPYEQLELLLEKADAASLQPIVDRLTEKKEPIPFLITFYKDTKIPERVANILEVGVAAIPLLSETEQEKLDEFLAEYERKIFGREFARKDLHDQFIARIYYLIQHREWVKANQKSAQRYFNLFINSELGLDILLDTLMEKYPDLLIPCNVKFQGVEARIPAFRLCTLSPTLAGMFTDLDNILPDTVLPLDYDSCEISKETARLFLDYLKYGKFDSIPLLDRAYLAQRFELDELGYFRKFQADFLPTLKTALQKEMYAILFYCILFIFRKPEIAQNLKSPQTEEINRFIDTVLELKKSGLKPDLSPCELLIQNSPKWGKYFLKKPPKLIWEINYPLSMEQLSWLQKHTACDYDTYSNKHALEQCYVCLQADNILLAKTFLNCAEDHRVQSASSYELTFSSIESLLTLYSFAKHNQAHNVVTGILKALQDKKDIEDISAILKAGIKHQISDWICIGLELLISQKMDIETYLPDLFNTLRSCGLDYNLFNYVEVKYQPDEHRVHITTTRTDDDELSLVLAIVQNLHKSVGITHLCASSKMWDAIGNQLDLLTCHKIQSN